MVLAFELFLMALCREIVCQYFCFFFVMWTIKLHIGTAGSLVERNIFCPVQEGGK